ncbi:MAG: tyrosinase family protein [Marmoricola sp.]|nr:tyrosinase family protein [Marmoricola sp.]
MARTRMDVWNRTRDEGDWPGVLRDYEVAVGKMRQLDQPGGKPGSPLGWRFQAAIHGLRSQFGGADTSNEFWSNCQHGSWYFLPWHRMYLAAFELIVQDALEDAEWSLPYWYSIDPDDAGKASLPPAFLDMTLDDNNLQTDERSEIARSGGAFYGTIPVEFLNESLIDALRADIFATPDGLSTFGGGERSDLNFSGDEAGLLEDVPHGLVHSLVGNDYDGQTLVNPGWMGSFYTAGLDPIFWLHHANLDRLWQVWLELDDSHVNPTGDSAFLDTEFTFPHPTRGTVTWRIGDALDSNYFGYEYESVAPPSAVVPQPGPEADQQAHVEDAMPASEPTRPPRVLGAASDVALTSADPVPVDLTPSRAGRSAGQEDAPRERAYLRVEGITGTTGAPLYGVYVNVPYGDDPTDHPELRAGSLSTFGLEESSRSDDEHDGSGLTATFDITALRDRLAAEGRWDEGHLEIRFTTHSPEPPAGLRRDRGVQDAPDIRARRVAVVSG